jgi:hypothetical protein
MKALLKSGEAFVCDESRIEGIEEEDGSPATTGAEAGRAAAHDERMAVQRSH